MANLLGTHPLIIDTPSGTALLTEPIRIQKIRWIGATTAGHTAVVTDVNNNVFWESVASGANYVESEDWSNLRWERRVMNGLKVPTLASGKLELYL